MCIITSSSQKINSKLGYRQGVKAQHFDCCIIGSNPISPALNAKRIRLCIERQGKTQVRSIRSHPVLIVYSGKTHDLIHESQVRTLLRALKEIKNNTKKCLQRCNSRDILLI